MFKNKKTINKITYFCACWLLIPMAYMAWCFSTVGYKNTGLYYVADLMGIICAAVYTIVRKKSGEGLKKQFQISDMAMTIIGLIMMAANLIEKSSNSIGASITFAVFVVIGVMGYCKEFKMLTGKAADWFKDNYLIVIVAVVSVAIAYDGNYYQFKWDGELYYQAVDVANLSSLSSVALYGHIAMASGGIMRLFAVLCGNTGTGLYIANLVAMLCGEFAFYGIVKTLVPDKKKWEYAVATGVYAFAPYIAGMAGYYSTDYFSVTTATILIYFVITKQWMLSIPAACYFVMTKEPALIAYGGLCLGLVINDLADAKGNLWKRILKVAGEIHYYFLLIPIVLWYVTYKILGQWSAGNGGFTISLNYIIKKCKVFMVLNFSWIYLVLIVAGIVIIIATRQFAKQKEWMVPLACSNIALLIFNCLFKTVNHPRYIDSFIAVQYSLAVLAVMVVFDKARFLLAALAVIQALSCYMTFDPVTLWAFNTRDTGGAKMASSTKVPFGDAAIYNKQMLWMEKPIYDAVESAVDSNEEIVFSIYKKSVYAFDGVSAKNKLKNGLEKDTQYLNRDTHSRSLEPLEEDSQMINIWHLPQEENLDDYDALGDKICIIYVKGITDYVVPKNYSLTGSQTFSYRGWTITKDSFERY